MAGTSKSLLDANPVARHHEATIAAQTATCGGHDADRQRNPRIRVPRRLRLTAEGSLPNESAVSASPKVDDRREPPYKKIKPRIRSITSASENRTIPLDERLSILRRIPALPSPVKLPASMPGNSTAPRHSRYGPEQVLTRETSLPSSSSFLPRLPRHQEPSLRRGGSRQEVPAPQRRRHAHATSRNGGLACSRRSRPAPGNRRGHLHPRRGGQPAGAGTNGRSGSSTRTEPVERTWMSTGLSYRADDCLIASFDPLTVGGYSQPTSEPSGICRDGLSCDVIHIARDKAVGNDIEAAPFGKAIVD
jgi:hypothetical protein